MHRINNLAKLKDRRRELRRNETKQEKLLWWHLKAGKIGCKFKRQHSVGGYILDFYCGEKKLVVEIDGGVHNAPEALEYDKVRDNFFKELGYSVMRFSNLEVDSNVFRVLTIIKEKLKNM